MSPKNIFYQTEEKYNVRKSHTPAEYSRILTAAVVNKQFCNMLLKNPAMALANGFCGEKFNLTKEEKHQVLSIRAASLEEFAQQLIADNAMARVSCCAGD